MPERTYTQAEMNLRNKQVNELLIENRKLENENDTLKELNDELKDIDNCTCFGWKAGCFALGVAIAIMIFV